MRSPFSFTTLCTLLLAAATLSSCTNVSNLVDAAGVSVGLNGQIEYDGAVAFEEVSLEFTLYRYLSNTDAVDNAACPVDAQQVPDCYGRVILDQLDDPVDSPDLALSWSQGQTAFSLEGVPADAAYFLVVRASAPDAQCSTDVLGYEDESKLATQSSVISPLNSGAATLGSSADLPRAVRISCNRIETQSADDVAPAPQPAPDPAVIDDAVEAEEGDLPAPQTTGWKTFEILDSRSDTSLAVASAGNVAGADDAAPCGDSFPLEVRAAVENFTGDRAYIHIQEGKGARAVIRDQIVKVNDGQISGQLIQLSGGYARIQLDTVPIEQSDFSSASFFIEVCSPDAEFDWPRQELLVVSSWDTNGTDVDIHAWTDDGSGGREDHIWWARQRGARGELDVDDVDGYGPETITSDEAQKNLTYDVGVHYYSARGVAAPTRVTVRIIYANQDARVYCDSTVTIDNIADGEWRPIGRLDASLAELATSDPETFGAIGCIQP